MKTKEEYIKEMLRVREDYPEETLNRVWEIFCHQNDIDYEDEVIGKIFDDEFEMRMEAKKYNL